MDQEVDTCPLCDEDLYTHDETTPSQLTDNDSDVKTTSAESVPLQGNSNVASTASLSLPQYSSIPRRYFGVFGIPAQNVTTGGLPRTEHTYNICNGLKNKPWATFRVVIRGYIAGESDTFLDHQVSIWTRASGDPRFPNQGPTKSSMENLRGHTNSPLLSCSQPTCIYQLLRQSFCP